MLEVVLYYTQHEEEECSFFLFLALGALSFIILKGLFLTLIVIDYVFKDTALFFKFCFSLT